MKLLRYRPKGSEQPVLVDKAGKLRDLSGVIPRCIWLGTLD